jgi:ABC-2 type transport system permease protein
MVLGTLYRRELGSFFQSPMAYVIIALVALVNAFIFYVWLQIITINHITEYNVGQAIFNGVFFWFLVMVLIPLLTMRTFAEEYKMGTIELLLTAPVREWEVVLAKYGAVLTLVLSLWGSTVCNLIYLYAFTKEKQPLIWGSLLLPYVMVTLFCMFYVSIGLLASSLTRNQILAGVMAFAATFLIFCMSFLSYLGLQEYKDVLSYFSATEQMETFSKGVFDSRPVVLYLSGTVFVLFLTQRVLQSRRLKS